MKKKFLALFLSLAMLLSLAPVSALAYEGGGEDAPYEAETPNDPAPPTENEEDAVGAADPADAEGASGAEAPAPEEPAEQVPDNDIPSDTSNEVPGEDDTLASCAVPICAGSTNWDRR